MTSTQTSIRKVTAWIDAQDTAHAVVRTTDTDHHAARSAAYRAIKQTVREHCNASAAYRPRLALVRSEYDWQLSEHLYEFAEKYHPKC
ncbi:hypothetical protein [Propionibacterium sp.]|uniref:hypothetical protein n=1 Tax=Propionibacterium sp. TaxID=1977903 RepID=UPI0039EC294B